MAGEVAVRVLLETERLVLRAFTMSDLDLVVELDGDPDVMHYITGGRPNSREELETDFLPAWLSYYDRYPAYGFWAAIEKATGEFLGWFHLRPPPGRPPDEPELGYRLRKAAWGKGYATEGSRALLQLAFTELDASRVTAETMAVNTASRRVMAKAGLRFFRTFFQDWPDVIEGSEHGDVEYAISRADWEQEQMTQPTWTAPEIARADPPTVADERTALEGWLDYHRRTLLFKCAGLTAEQLTQRSVEPSSMSLLGLVRHMADVERAWFRRRFAKEQIDGLYWSEENLDGDFDDVDSADAEADFATFHSEVDAARAAAAGHSLDETFHHPRLEIDMDLRWIYLHMIEEYARHNGHADLLRERIDGTVGD
jgi:RimJ/RimL family protein N-acetyltransferase/uncharacterized damage-inducible protein DinB